MSLSRELQLEIYGFYETATGSRITQAEYDVAMAEVKAELARKAAARSAEPKTVTVPGPEPTSAPPVQKAVVHHHNLISLVSDPKPKLKSDQNLQDAFKNCDLKQWGGLKEAMKARGTFDEYETRTTYDDGGYHTERVRI